MKNLFAVLLVGLALVLAGCASQQPPSTSPTPTVQPTVTATPTPSAETPTPTATSTPTPTASPEQQLSDLKNDAGRILQEVFSKEISFTADRDPASGAVTYYGVASTNYFELQVSIAKAVSRQWPPTKTLVEMQGESGVRKTIAFTQSNLQQPKIETNAEFECNGFSQTIVLTVSEASTASLPFQNLASTAVGKLIDACP